MLWRSYPNHYWQSSKEGDRREGGRNGENTHQNIAKVNCMMRKLKLESKESTFFWTMEFHIKFIEAIIYCLDCVITHHPGQHKHVWEVPERRSSHITRCEIGTASLKLNSRYKSNFVKLKIIHIYIHTNI